MQMLSIRSSQAEFLALGVAKGLSYLHHDLKEPIIHRDVKPGNIMIAAGTPVTAKLGDFGESTHFDKQRAVGQKEEDQHNVLYQGEAVDDALSMTAVGTRLYCAPEVMKRERKCDFASLRDRMIYLTHTPICGTTHRLQRERRPVLLRARAARDRRRQERLC